MKSIFLVTCIFLSSGVLKAGDFFRSVHIYSDTWEISFPEVGGRYALEIDGFSRGTSGYLQRLILKKSEVLRCIDKHWDIVVRPAAEDGQDGVELIRHYADRFTGARKEERTFERVQGP